MRQQRLHVASPVGNEVHNDIPAGDAVNEPVGLKKYLSVVLDTQTEQLFRITAAIRHDSEFGCRLEQLFEYVVGIGRVIEFGDVTLNRFNILLSDGLDLACGDFLVSQREQFQQCQRFLSGLVAGHILQNGPGLAILRDYQRLALFIQRIQHLCCMGLQVTDRFDLA